MNQPRTLTEADLPIHPDPHAWTWTELEKRAILRWGQDLLDAMTSPPTSTEGRTP